MAKLFSFKKKYFGGIILVVLSISIVLWKYRRRTTIYDGFQTSYDVVGSLVQVKDADKMKAMFSTPQGPLTDILNQSDGKSIGTPWTFEKDKYYIILSGLVHATDADIKEMRDRMKNGPALPPDFPFITVDGVYKKDNEYYTFSGTKAIGASIVSVGGHTQVLGTTEIIGITVVGMILLFFIGKMLFGGSSQSTETNMNYRNN
jgi:hypothetical protein